MRAVVTRPVQQRAGHFDRLCLLPVGRDGNSLDDTSWPPVLEISGQAVSQVPSTLRDRSGQSAAWQIWVGGSGYGGAEAALLAAMPSPAREAGRGDSAWR